jgi:hypothetical protein
LRARFIRPQFEPHAAKATVNAAASSASEPKAASHATNALYAGWEKLARSHIVVAHSQCFGEFTERLEGAVFAVHHVEQIRTARQLAMMSEATTNASKVARYDVELLGGEDLEVLSGYPALIQRIEVAMLHDLLVEPL